MKLLNLSTYLVPHPEDTFYVRFAGLILVVDRAAITDDGDVVVARAYGELSIYLLSIIDGRARLYALTDVYESTRVYAWMDFEVFGKVLYTMHTL